MPEIGGVFTKTIEVSKLSFTTVLAPTGEQIKITNAYGKATYDGDPRNDQLAVSPASGAEIGATAGTKTSKLEVPLLGANPSNGSSDITTLQPIYITDSEGMYVGNINSNDPVDVVIQGVRVA